MDSVPRRQGPPGTDLWAEEPTRRVPRNPRGFDANLLREGPPGVPQDEAGAWKCELWTKRAFGPNELAFAPLSSQLKDTHLTIAAHIPVGLPRHGAGAHPDGGSLALDGRSRTSLAAEKLVDTTEHRGSLFWLVQRCSDAKSANMSLEPVAWEHKVILRLPFKKDRTSSDWEPKHLPTIPVLMHKNAVKAHELLVYYAAPVKKDDGRNDD